jgi:hypothetical protein
VEAATAAVSRGRCAGSAEGGQSSGGSSSSSTSGGLWGVAQPERLRCRMQVFNCQLQLLPAGMF